MGVWRYRKATVSLRVEIGLRCGPTFYHICLDWNSLPRIYLHRISTGISTVSKTVSLPWNYRWSTLIHHSTIVTTRKLCCAHNPFILNWISLSSIHITLLFLHRSLPLTGISNLPSPFYLFHFHPRFSISATFAEKVQPIVRVVDMAWGWRTNVSSRIQKGGRRLVIQTSN